ncbi:MAG: ferrous iron transport protein A [Bradyrhizobiaceae bacterium]|nr:MAG: ferrous iron transport protein A [Bradyrhizobiaceae bacterium]
MIGNITVAGDHNGVPAAEIERRLLELGFVEGARVEVLHEGPIAGDPIAVRVDNNTIALRRREAMSIFVA